MRHLQDSKIWSTFKFWFYYQTTTESVSKIIVEGTDVFVVLPTGYYKNNAVYNYYMSR